MKYFDTVLFISLLGIAVMQYMFNFIGGFGFAVLIIIATLGLLPMRILLGKTHKVKLILQRIAGKAQRQ
ncbi:MAG: hypothetical protein R6U85_12990 [Salinivirgaceae bacterium]